MMKKTLFLLGLLPLLATAQVRIPKDANRFTYWQFDYGEKNDTSEITVYRSGKTIYIHTQSPEGKLIQGYCQTVTEVDYDADSITVTATYDDSVYYYRTGFSRSDLEWEVKGKTHICHINSNRLEFEMDEKAPVSVTPLPYYGLNKGVLRSFTRNGQKRLVLAKAERSACMPSMRLDGDFGKPSRRVSPRELDRIMKERLVVTTRIFDHEQICWGKESAHLKGNHKLKPSSVLMPYDTVLHFAGGTIILKRVRLPWLPAHYQHFIEVHQQSNGDAYDRTGSIFVIPTDGYVLHNFFDGVNNHPDSLPTFVGRDGQRYQGMISEIGYTAPLELVRFFTPFGVGKFNERMKDFGIQWRDEAYYRQEITDIYNGIYSDVIIGAWIGNYDAGGHLITVDIKSYPNSYSVPDPEKEAEEGPDWSGLVVPLFNTCNVLEMAGQNYGKLFGTDSLTVKFQIYDTLGIEAIKSARLRYISTGHGGWGEGDEFVPKQNTILIDGKPAFTYTPWRQDCGCYRDLNPVSGNFWNGLSSSDFSRSGWCPGTATQPVYFDMMPWADGKEHTMTVAIPQGKPVEGMFSHWAVSGALIIEY
ncbi:MAG: glpgli family protein [Bacteroidales bacterium]|nr:glpgli family protein [Bacteroidales bacterium]